MLPFLLARILENRKVCAKESQGFVYIFRQTVKFYPKNLYPPQHRSCLPEQAEIFSALRH